MSGGSYGYIYSRLLDVCENSMYDREMNALIQDIAKVLHDLEWWQSSDISEATYRKTVSEFKKKWLGGNREERLKDMINEIFNEAKKEASELIGENDEVKDT